MDKDRFAILKMHGQANRLISTCADLIKGTGIGGDVTIDENSAHAINNIVEDIITTVLESVPRPTETDPNADLLKALENSRVKYTKRKAFMKNPPDMPVIDDINQIVTAYINASVVLQYLLDNALNARIDGESPLDALTDKEKDSINFALSQVVRTAKPFERLVNGSIDTE